MERLWRGAGTNVSRFDALIVWANNLRGAVDDLTDDGEQSSSVLKELSAQIDRNLARFQPGGQVRAAFEKMHQAFPVMYAAAKELGACVGLDRPEDIIQLEPGWIDALLSQTARWKANVVRAQPWAIWRAAARTARAAGLAPVVDAVETGLVPGDQLLRAFDFAYARWVAGPSSTKMRS